MLEWNIDRMENTVLCEIILISAVQCKTNLKADIVRYRML